MCRALCSSAGPIFGWGEAYSYSCLQFNVLGPRLDGIPITPYVQAIDDDANQVAQMLAAQMDWPQVCGSTADPTHLHARPCTARVELLAQQGNRTLPSRGGGVDGFSHVVRACVCVLVVFACLLTRYAVSIRWGGRGGLRVQATFASEITLADDVSAMTVVREIDGGLETISVDLPVRAPPTSLSRIRLFPRCSPKPEIAHSVARSRHRPFLFCCWRSVRILASHPTCLYCERCLVGRRLSSAPTSGSTSPGSRRSRTS